jgi:hypothetical protein
VDLSPIPEMAHLYSKDAVKSYRKMTAHDKLMEELRAINLAPSSPKSAVAANSVAMM